jgi:hypothetical protein
MREERREERIGLVHIIMRKWRNKKRRNKRSVKRRYHRTGIAGIVKENEEGNKEGE